MRAPATLLPLTSNRRGSNSKRAGWQGAGALEGPNGREQPGGLVRETEADVLGKGGIEVPMGRAAKDEG